MTAACVLFLAVAGTLIAVKISMARLDNSRRLDTASQVMQSEFERLRLRNWTQLQAMQDSGATDVQTDLPAAAGIRFTRRIVDLRDGLKEISVEATWGAAGERARTARMVTRYARNGLNDYVYTTR